jgi:hypothetical protein
VVLYLHSPSTPSWHGAQLKAQGQLYLTLYVELEADFPTAVTQGYIQKFPNWPLGARTENVTALCY